MFITNKHQEILRNRDINKNTEDKEEREGSRGGGEKGQRNN